MSELSGPTLRAQAHEACEQQAAQDATAAQPFWRQLAATLPQAVEQASRAGRTEYTVDLRQATRSGPFGLRVAPAGVRRALRRAVERWATTRGLRTDDPYRWIEVMDGPQPDEVRLRWGEP